MQAARRRSRADVPPAGLSVRCTAWQRPATARCSSYGIATALRRSTGLWLLLALLSLPPISGQPPGGGGGGGVNFGGGSAPTPAPNASSLPVLDYLGVHPNTFFSVVVDPQGWPDSTGQPTDVNLQSACLNVTLLRLQEQGIVMSPPDGVPGFSGTSSGKTVRVALTASFTGKNAFNDPDGLKRSLALTQYLSTYESLSWTRLKDGAVEFCLVDDESNLTRAEEMYRFWTSTTSRINLLLGPSHHQWGHIIARLSDRLSIPFFAWASSSPSFYHNNIWGTQQPDFTVLISAASLAYEQVYGVVPAARRLTAGSVEKETNSEHYGSESESKVSFEDSFAKGRQARRLLDVPAVPTQEHANSQLLPAHTENYTRGSLLRGSSLRRLQDEGGLNALREGRLPCTGDRCAHLDVYMGSSTANNDCCRGQPLKSEIQVDSCRQYLAYDAMQGIAGTMWSKVTCFGSEVLEFRTYWNEGCREDEEVKPASGWQPPGWSLECGQCTKVEDQDSDYSWPYMKKNCGEGQQQDVTRFYYDWDCQNEIAPQIFRKGICEGPLRRSEDTTQHAYWNFDWAGFCDANDSPSLQQRCDQCLQPLQPFCSGMLDLFNYDMHERWRDFLRQVSGCEVCQETVLEYCLSLQPKGFHLVAPFAPISDPSNGLLNILSSQDVAGVVCCRIQTVGEEATTQVQFLTPPECAEGCTRYKYLEASLICQKYGRRLCYATELLSGAGQAKCSPPIPEYWVKVYEHLMAYMVGNLGQVFFQQPVTGYCTNGKWIEPRKGYCLQAVAGDTSCSSEWFGEGNTSATSGKCWCVTRGDGCTDRRPGTPISSYQIVGKMLGPSACPVGSLLVNAPMFDCSPAFHSARFSTAERNVFTIPKGLIDMWLFFGFSGQISVGVIDSSSDQIIASVLIPDGTVTSNFQYESETYFHEFTYKDLQFTLFALPSLHFLEIWFKGEKLPMEIRVQFNSIGSSTGRDVLYSYVHNGFRECTDSFYGLQGVVGPSGCTKYWSDDCWLRPPQCLRNFTYMGTLITNPSGCTTQNFGLQGWCSSSPIASASTWHNCSNTCVEGVPICPIGYEQAATFVFPCVSTLSNARFPRKTQVELVGASSSGQGKGGGAGGTNRSRRVRRLQAPTSDDEEKGEVGDGRGTPAPTPRPESGVSQSIVQIPMNIHGISFTVTSSVDFDIEVLDSATGQYLFHRTIGVVNQFYGYGDRVAAVYLGLELSQNLVTEVTPEYVGYRCTSIYKTEVVSDQNTCEKLCNREEICRAVTWNSDSRTCEYSSDCSSRERVSGLSERSLTISIKRYARFVSIQGVVGPSFDLEMLLYSVEAGSADVSYAAGDVNPCPLSRFNTPLPPGCVWAGREISSTTTSTTQVATYVRCPQGTLRDMLIIVGCIQGTESHIQRQETFLVDGQASGRIMDVTSGVSDVSLKAISSKVRLDLSLVVWSRGSYQVVVGGVSSMSNLRTEGSVMGMQFLWQGSDDKAPYESFLRLVGTATGPLQIHLTFEQGFRASDRHVFDLEWEYRLASCNTSLGCRPFNQTVVDEAFFDLGSALALEYTTIGDMQTEWESARIYRDDMPLGAVPWSSFESFLKLIIGRQRHLRHSWKPVFHVLDVNLDGFLSYYELQTSSLLSQTQNDIDGAFWNEGFSSVFDVNVQPSHWGEHAFKELWSRGAKKTFFIAHTEGPMSMYNLCEGARRLALSVGFVEEGFVIASYANQTATYASLSRNQSRAEDVIVFCGSVTAFSNFLITIVALDLHSRAIINMYPAGNQLTSLFGSYFLRGIIEPIPWKFQLLDQAFGPAKSWDLFDMYLEAFQDYMTLAAAQIFSVGQIIFAIANFVHTQTLGWMRSASDYLKANDITTVLGKLRFTEKGKRRYVANQIFSTEARQFEGYPEQPQNEDERIIRFYTTTMKLIGNRSEADWNSFREFAYSLDKSRVPVSPSTRLLQEEKSLPWFDMPNYSHLLYPRNTSTDNFREVYVCIPGCVFDAELCNPCPPGRYRSENDIYCEACPFDDRVKTYTAQWGASRCEKCPTEATCSGRNQIPIATAGHYRLDLVETEKDPVLRQKLLDGRFVRPGYVQNITMAVAQDICDAGFYTERFTYWSCFPEDICKGNNICREGNTGLFCGSCREGYSFWGFKRGTLRCEKCSDDYETLGWIIFFGLIYFVCTFLLSDLVKHHATKKGSIAIGAFRIIMTHLQLLSAVTTMSELDSIVSLYNWFPGPLADIFVTPWLVVQVDCWWQKSRQMDMLYWLLGAALAIIPMGIGCLCVLFLTMAAFREMRFHRHRESKEMTAKVNELQRKEKSLKEANDEKDTVKALEERKKREKKEEKGNKNSKKQLIDAKKARKEKKDPLDKFRHKASTMELGKDGELEDRRKDAEEQLFKAINAHQKQLEVVMEARAAENQTRSAMRKELMQKHREALFSLFRHAVSWLFLAYPPVLSVSARLTSCTGIFDQPRLRMALAIECESSQYNDVYWTATLNFVTVGMAVPAFLCLVMVLIVIHVGSLDDMRIRQTLGLIFIGYKPNYWTFGILNLVKVAVILLVTTVQHDQARSFGSLGLIVTIMTINHFSDQNDTDDRESLGYLEFLSSAALLLTSAAGLLIKYKDYDPEGDTASDGVRQDFFEAIDDWKHEIASLAALLNVCVLLSGMFVIMYNNLATKLVIAQSAGARLSQLNVSILSFLRWTYGLAELTLHTSQDEICVVYDTSTDDACDFSQQLWEQFHTQLACGVQELNECGAFDIQPTNICLVLTPQALSHGEVREALEFALVEKKNIIIIHAPGVDIDIELLVAFEEKELDYGSGLTREAFKEEMQKLVYREKSVVHFTQNPSDDEEAMKKLTSKLDLIDPRAEVGTSSETIDMSMLKEAERQVVHQGMKEIVQACMDGSEFFSPSLCAKAFVRAFQRATHWRGVTLTAWEQQPKKYNRLGPFNHDKAHRSITVDEFYAAVRDVNDDLIDQHPDIVKLLVAKEDTQSDRQKQAIHLRKVNQAIRPKKKKKEHHHHQEDNNKDPKYSSFPNACYQEAPKIDGNDGYHCPRCMRLFTIEEAQAQWRILDITKMEVLEGSVSSIRREDVKEGMFCTCPGSMKEDKATNPLGENKLQWNDNKIQYTELVPGGLQAKKKLEVWMEAAPDAVEVEDNALQTMSKFDKQSIHLMKRQWLRDKLAKREADVKLLEHRLDNQLRHNARKEQASTKASNSGNKPELELERLLGRTGGAGPPLASDNATLFSSWAEDGSKTTPSSLLSPRARGLVGSNSAEEKIVPRSFWDHMDGFASDLKARFAPRLVEAEPARPNPVQPNPSQLQSAVADPLQALGRDLSAYLAGSATDERLSITNGNADVSGALATESRPKAKAKSRADALRKVDLEDQANGDNLAVRLGLSAWEVDAETDETFARLAASSPPSSLPLSSMTSGKSMLMLKFKGDRKKVVAGVFRTMFFSELRKLGATSKSIDAVSFSLMPEQLSVQISGPTDVISDLSAFPLWKLKVVGCSVTEVNHI